MYREIFIQAGLKLLKIWWPCLLIIDIGLIYLFFIERRDKHKKRSFRRQSEKVH